MDTLQKKWFVVFRFYSKVLSKCHFIDPKFKYFLAENPPGLPTYVITLWGPKTHVVPPLGKCFPQSWLHELRPSAPIRTVKTSGDIFLVQTFSSGYVYHSFHFYFYDFQVAPAELELSNSIWQMWDDLYMQSKWVDASLVSVKMKFTEVRNVRPAVCCTT